MLLPFTSKVWLFDGINAFEQPNVPEKLENNLSSYILYREENVAKMTFISLRAIKISLDIQ